MSYEFYKVAHFLGIFLLAAGLLAYAFLKWNDSTPKASVRKFSAIFHGVGLTFILVSGFGLLARLNMVRDLPGWVYVKLAIWLALGGAIALAKRYSKGTVSVAVILTLLVAAAWTAVNKPF